MVRAPTDADSIIARPTLQPEFFNSLGYKRTFSVRPSMSAFGGKADIGASPPQRATPGKLDQTQKMSTDTFPGLPVLEPR